LRASSSQEANASEGYQDRRCGGYARCRSDIACKSKQPTSSEVQGTATSGWSFNVAPYLWLPTINTTLNYNLPPLLGGRLPTDVSAGPGDILSHLNFATMAAASAQYGRYSLLTDFLYLNVSAAKSHTQSLNFFGLPSRPISRSVETRIDTSFTYRYLSFEHSDSSIIKRLSMCGPVMMVSSSF
jgi:hypothetical protein